MKKIHEFDDPRSRLVYEFDDADMREITELKLLAQCDAVAEGRPFDDTAYGEVDLSEHRSVEDLRKWFEAHDDEFRQQAESDYIDLWEKNRKANSY